MAPPETKSPKVVAPTLEPAGFFALRTPLLPFDELSAFGAGLHAVAATPADLPAALAADRQLLRQRLRALVARPEVLEALFIASPSLEESLPAWHEAPESERGQKVERSLVRYLTRMSARATPFGLFAGCSVGRLGATTELVIAARDRYRRHTRLDGDYLSALTDALQRDPELRRALTFRTSSSLYRTGQRMRYVEGIVSGKERTRSYRLVDLEPSEALTATLERATGGARLDALAEALVAGDADGDITRADADEFIAELVDAQILVADLAPQVTGAEPIYDLIAQLRAADSAAAAPLEDVRRALATLDASPLGASPSAYRDAAGHLTPLPVAAELARLFQVDLTKPAPEATLGPQPIAELTRVLELQRRLTTRHPSAALQRFRTAFAGRYEARQVPLAEVLDEDHGIGFDRTEGPSAEVSPLLEGIAFGGPAGASPPSLPPIDKLTTLLFLKVDEALRADAEEIVLSEAELESCFVKDPPPLASSFALMGTLAAASAEALAAGDYRVWLQYCTGPSGANILGRFCHGDEELTALVRDHLRAEEAQRPDAIFAELVHLPQGRIGNILLRPLLREHEISFLGRSGAPVERQIQLDDLLVSIEDGRIVLRSRRLGKEIIPRLTSAHAFSNPGNLGVYQFLCALQQQDGELPGFDWGVLETKRYLPRVRVGQVVLKAQRWRVRKPDLTPLEEARSAAERFTAVQALRASHRLPRWVAVTDADNVLPIDLDNSLAVDTFVQLVKQRPHVVLTELFGQNELCARGPEGAFVHELVIPMLVRGPAAQPTAATSPPATRPARHSPAARTARHSIARSLPPGSDWLYAKLYCGTADADRVLRDAIAPLATQLRDAGVVDHWFFIRYADPDFHLRLRLHGDPEQLLGGVYPLVCRAFAAELAGGLAWKLQLDTYERELERYGGDWGMPLAEQLFAADSEAVLAIVATLAGAAGAEARWKLTLRGIDQLLDDVGLSLPEKLQLMSGLRDGFASELTGGAALDRQLGDRYRKERTQLETLLDRSRDAGSDYEPGFAAFAARSARIAPIAAALRAHAAAGRLTTSLAELAGSFVHMHANRMFRGAARAQELVLYDFLTRLYQGRIAREKSR
jgi:thiopeptide-type bacteriocin biosynthesis protein